MHSHQDLINQSLAQVNAVILGKKTQVRLAFCCLFSGGHLLLEDLPGMGKTTLAHALAITAGLPYKRIQFTSDLLPSDVIGANVYESGNGSFRFHPGPVFSNVVLADELNRTTPKSQSALLEAMEEGQVSVDGESYSLPSPFFVIATQNPLSQSGTFPLPESQLDRFLIRFSLGYPDPDFEKELLRGRSGRAGLEQMVPILNPDRVADIQKSVNDVSVSEELLSYVQRLVQSSRESEMCLIGLSPRGAQALLRSARAWALIHGRSYVQPDDVQAVFIAVAGHRLVGRERQGEALARQLLEAVAVIA